MVRLDIRTLTLNWAECLKLGFLRTYYLTCQGRIRCVRSTPSPAPNIFDAFQH